MNSVIGNFGLDNILTHFPICPFSNHFDQFKIRQLILLQGVTGGHRGRNINVAN